ncbi:MAG: hypothetical protein A3I89_02565 [Candidatus Harrisonbacteria bacterium RIFCSPLOWO2_02_FULL_41_11]|uniref:Uncharacterized protein n=1 Tax=Candidatus Harrisonbacteria bacterium RIFCSPHIGHO2_02_FULL_42_16 TaxID=1798404 RepID=A0A1G1ZJE6_9BACT|nr:MAG: hypothetical protein A3B92_00280 [Candidatus Harrisonbacteria bacterium RIFCSPHIGHO2_02_FULL_42_16]OGY66546.1 MAG: hypothetical protein A3I89_02565 [Candidatus Harrisonbacteria bacterium RIFCSPLOWO2_02_FULL_41_11]
MKIRSDGLVRRVAYPSFMNFRGWIPGKVSLCILFRRFIFMLFIVWPVVLFVLAIVYLSGILFAKHPSSSVYGPVFISYKKWPTIKGFRVLPIYFFLLYLSFFTKLGRYAFLGFTFLALCLAILFLYYALENKLLSSDNEAVKLIREYVVAVKNKVCPMVEIKGD